jgi:hypothetical protein
MLTLLCPHFLIKIPRQDQKNKKTKIGSLFIPETAVYMTREVQYGEIVAIGMEAHEDFPEAKIGDILLTHHFTSGKVSEGSDDGTHLIQQDDEYNYYLVTSRSFNGRANECYGSYDKKTKRIIPHPEFVFLESEKVQKTTSYDKFLNQSTTTTASGLIVFKAWRESREDITEKNKKIKARVQQLSNIGNGMTDEIRNEIYNLEREMEANTKRGNKKTYLPYVVAAANPKIESWFNSEVKEGETVYCLNIASGTTIEFLGVEYRIVKIQYISFPHKFLKKAVDQYRLKTA